MRITPLDVRKQEFRRSVRGYDCDEVHAFLSTLADEYEAVLLDNKQVREQIIESEEKIAEYRNMERALRDTLLTAERITKEARENADKEGGLIVKDAQIKAKQVLEECRMRMGELRREIHALRQEKETYLARFKSLAESQVQFIDTHRHDFDDLDKRMLEMMESVTYGVQEGNDASGQRTSQQTDVGVPATGSPAGTGTSDDVWRKYQSGQDTEPTPETAPREITPTVAQSVVAQPAPAVEPVAQEIRIPWSSPRSQAASVDLAAMGIPIPAVPTARIEQQESAPEIPPEIPVAEPHDLPQETHTLDAQQEAILEALQEVPQGALQDQAAQQEVPPSWAPEKHDLWDTLTT